jgi:hypothetical protein
MTRRTPSIEQALIDGISKGITLNELCREHRITRRTVNYWMEDGDFAARMARARALGFDALVDEMLEIADDGRNDWMERKDAKLDAPPMRNPESVARSRLRIETRMRILSYWYPRRFGGMMGRMGGVAGIAGLIAAQSAGAEREAGAIDAVRPMDSVAIAARISSILATIAARDPEDDGLEGLGNALEGGPGDDRFGDEPGDIIEHEDTR